MDTFLTLILGIAIGFFLARGFTSSQIKKVIEEKQTETDKRKQSIIKTIQANAFITNDEVEELLGVGNTAAYNYLEALEQEGKIEQIGKTGKHVKYRLKS